MKTCGKEKDNKKMGETKRKNNPVVLKKLFPYSLTQKPTIYVNHKKILIFFSFSSFMENIKFIISQNKYNMSLFYN